LFGLDAMSVSSPLCAATRTSLKWSDDHEKRCEPSTVFSVLVWENGRRSQTLPRQCPCGGLSGTQGKPLEAQNVTRGIEREKLVRRARQTEIFAHMQDWLMSPCIQPPK